MKVSSTRIAVFYDWLNHRHGGAERVLLDILKIYPQADLFTLVSDHYQASWLPPGTKISSSILRYLPGSKSNPAIYTPIYTPALQLFNFSKYHIVISTTSTIGHQLRVPKKTLYVCYFHNINRYLYQIPPTFIRPLLSLYTVIDRHLAKRPDVLLCNSKTVQDRISGTYQRQSSIIYPGIDQHLFRPISNPSKNYFLIVSRLVKHKNIENAIRLCQQRKILLKIIGSGRELVNLKKIANEYTQFIGNIDDHQLVSYYQNCLALIHPQHEDFGLSSLECQACGRPVIAFGAGGATETVIHNQTGFLYAEHNQLEKYLSNKLIDTINPINCRKNAIKFSRQAFMLHFKKAIDRSWQNHTT